MWRRWVVCTVIVVWVVLGVLFWRWLTCERAYTPVSQPQAATIARQTLRKLRAKTNLGYCDLLEPKVSEGYVASEHMRYWDFVYRLKDAPSSSVCITVYDDGGTNTSFTGLGRQMENRR